MMTEEKEFSFLRTNLCRGCGKLEITTMHCESCVVIPPAAHN